MLEKLLDVGGKISHFVLGATLLLNSCYLKTISSGSVQLVNPVEKALDKQIDYNKLTWQEAIKKVQTPEQVQDYLDRHLIFKENEKETSFAIIHTDRKGDCHEYAIASAALLSDDGYKPYILSMFTTNYAEGHSVFLYRIPQGYGALGNSPLPPHYDTVEDLIKMFNFLTGIKFTKYVIIDLEKSFPNKEWIASQNGVDEYLPPFSFTDMEL